ncbi:MAG: hypothetical protein R6X02_05880 [Enhygromyxa sp.]
MRLIDQHRLGRSLAAGVVSLSLVLALPVTAVAAPAQAPTPEGPAAPSSEAPAEVPEQAAIRSALEAGDLSSARELALARSEILPSAESFALEAEVHLALGDYERAKAALDRAIAALPEDASDDRAALTQLREDIEARSRGTRADEPESTHREELDRERAERLAALAPKPPPPSEPIDEPKPREPIVKKWYFWVTLGAIAATAGAIVGVAVASSLEERKGDAAARQGLPAGGMTIRF